MQNIYDNPAELEQIAAEQYAIPDFIMMENAARSMKEFILDLPEIKTNFEAKKESNVLIICGKGNNGGDGYALARLLQGNLSVTVLTLSEPTAEQAIQQQKICKRLGIKIINSLLDYAPTPDVIVDCLYGIGFYGDLSQVENELIETLNKMKAVRIACDIPSALLFDADYTITMGFHKLQLFSDKAKSVCGQIIVANLGISKERFEEPLAQDLLDEDTISLMPFPSAYLIEKSDAKLPLRNNPAAHKGSFGHTAVFAGEKPGAGIISATAAMNFGSGLTTIIKTPASYLEQFKISPELMVSDTIPSKTTCVILGPGLGGSEEEPVPDEPISQLMTWFENTKNPACVLDADIFNFIELQSLLEELNKVENARIVLTPHMKEYEKLVDKVPNVSSLQNVTVVRKSSNTFISSNNTLYVVADGSPSLAKGGSGDALAGMIGALLAQGYPAKDAAITACEIHALAGREFGKDAFNLTPEKLLSLVKAVHKK